MLRIMFKQIYRRPRYPLALAIGIILAVGLIAGINMTIDNMTGFVFQKQLEHTPVDFVASKDVFNLTSLPNLKLVEYLINHVKYVKHIEAAWQLPLYYQYFNKTPFHGNISKFENITQSSTVEPKQKKWVSPMIMGVPENFGTNVTGVSWIDGKISKSNNFTVCIPYSFAKEYNLSVGDTFYLISEKHSYNPITHEVNVSLNNLELKVSGIYEFTGTLAKIFTQREEYFLTSFTSAYEIFKNASQHTTMQMGGVSTAIGGITYEGNFRVYIFIDRKAVIIPYNLDVTSQRLQKIQNSLTLQLADQGFSVTNHISIALQYVSYWSMAARTEFGIFSVPVILLGAFLTTTVAYVLLEERRREIGLMKIRGATDNQIKKLLAYESIMIGLLAGVIGIFLASGFSAYFTSRLATLWEIKNVQLSYLPTLGFDTYFGIGLAFVLSAIAGYIPSRAAANLTPIESIESHIEDIESARWKPKWTLLWLVLGGYKIVMWILNIHPDIWSMMMSPNFFVVIAVVLYILIDSLLQPIAPFLFIYGATKIVTMYSYKFTHFFSSIIKPIGGSISKVAVGGILRKPSRYARVGFILALAIGLGIMISISQASSYDYQIRMVKVSAGADINVSTYTNNLTMYNNMTKISGVTNVTGIFQAYVTIGSVQIEVIGINPSKYLSVGSNYIENDFTERGMKSTLMQMTKNQSLIMASRGFLDSFGLTIGDNFALKLNVNATTSTSLNLTVIDKLLALPGENWLFLSTPVVILNINLLNETGVLQNYLSPSGGGIFSNILVDVQENANVTRVAEEIKNMYPDVSTYVAKQHIDEIEKDPLSVATIEFLNINYLLMILIATIGLGFIIFMSVMERQTEFGIMIARGASTWQIIRLLFAESTIIMLVSVAIGAITGFAGGIGMATYINSLVGGQMIPARAIIPYTAYYIVIGSVVAFLVATIIPAYIASKTNIRDVLHLG